jgi:acetyl esterase/lipase
VSQDLLPDAVVRYAEFDEAVIDLHLPDPPTANRNLVFLVHGGFWKQVWDRTHTRAQARALAEAGYLVATPEYRRVGGEGGWPTTPYDVLAAYLALPGLVAGLDLRFDRIVTMGHSAGGHLVLWLAAQELTGPPHRTVAVAPVADLVLATELGLGSGATQALLGDTPVAEADPNTLLTDPPAGAVVVVHGEDDTTVPIELGRSFVAAHPWAELVALRGVDHFEFLDPTSTAWASLRAALAAGSERGR